jgi:hypothetical protein
MGKLKIAGVSEGFVPFGDQFGPDLLMLDTRIKKNFYSFNG